MAASMAYADGNASVTAKLPRSATSPFPAALDDAFSTLMTHSHNQRDRDSKQKNGSKHMKSSRNESSRKNNHDGNTVNTRN